MQLLYRSSSGLGILGIDFELLVNRSAPRQVRRRPSKSDTRAAVVTQTSRPHLNNAAAVWVPRIVLD